MNLNELKQRLIDAGHILENAGQGDLTRGHVSIRSPEDPSLFIMKPHSYGFDEITLENIVVCNMDGVKIDGGGRRHSEVFIHSEIYKARPDVNSVIHTHPTYAVALSATGQALEPISQPAVAFADGLPYFSRAIDLVRSQDLGAAVAGALGQHKAVLLRNHGAAIVGANVEEATILSIMLDNACQIQLATMAAKESVNRAFESGLSDGVMFERRLFHGLFATADQKEGMDAFLNKRAPNFVNG